MLYLIVYDVEEDAIRRKVANMLLDMGGERIQYSAFKIELEKAELAALMEKIRKTVGTGKARVTAIPICRRDIDKVKTIAHNYHLPASDVLI
ncbi:MAG: CRISPR-associated endonuclease Cas2 [Thermoprotei archaeon]|nr:MAG: CRISPR-associated endonuclease Cas2 [Thermoprotei archaeon]